MTTNNRKCAHTATSIRHWILMYCLLYNSPISYHVTRCPRRRHRPFGTALPALTRSLGTALPALTRPLGTTVIALTRPLGTTVIALTRLCGDISQALSVLAWWRTCPATTWTLGLAMTALARQGGPWRRGGGGVLRCDARANRMRNEVYM